MQIVISNIKMPIKHNKDMVLKAAREIVRSASVSAKDFVIYKQSLDARRKNNIHYIYSVTATTNDNIVESENISVFKGSAKLNVKKVPLKSQPIVVGMGPCGLFAAYILALSGNPPIIIERGEAVDERTKTVNEFWNGKKLNPNSNVQFGEGGAGTFSDGKLTTRIGDVRQRFILDTFKRFGAPEDIVYRAKPHIGTDKLKEVVKNMRKELIDMGCDIRFNSCLTDVLIENKKVFGAEVNNSEIIKSEYLVLAIGHSSRDTYSLLCEKGVEMIKKPFAIGVRIEHSQSFIDKVQYGAEEGLPPADYKVAYNGKERSCYSFCMCPGGTVVNASSEEGGLTVNGMSNYLRDARCANSALVVSVRPDDFDDGVLGGVEFQRRYEKFAYNLGEGYAPIQLAEDFIKDKPTLELKNVKPSVTGGYKIRELKKCLPNYVVDTLRSGLNDFERKIHGFSGGGAVLTGIEARTSAPLRILRGENMESVNIKGLFPSGEGAGYAGGIVSAALDGMKTAFAMIDECE